MTEKDPLNEYQEVMGDMDLSNQQGSQTREIIKIPWWWRELGIKKLALLILKILGGIAGVYMIYHFTGPYSFLGLLPIPFWYWYIKRKIQDDDMELWEIRVPGQIVKLPSGDHEIKDRTINRYRIPSDLYPYHDIQGTPFNLGSVYICDYYDPEEAVIVFPEIPALSNLVRYKDALWIHLKDLVPKLERKVYIMTEANKMMAQREAVNMLKSLDRVDSLYLSRRRIVGKKQIKDPGEGE